MGAERTRNVIRNFRGARWWLGPSADRDRVEPLLAAALEAVESGATNQKTGRRKELYRLALLGDQPDHLLKVTRYHNGSPWLRRIRRSKARRELDVAVELRAREIDTPIPVAAGECRRGGLLTACYLLVPFEPDAVDLRDFLDSSARPEAKRAVARGFGALAQRLHTIGFRQADFAPNNFLLRGVDGSEIVPIDFERASVSTGRSTLGQPERVQSLAKLERHCVNVGSTDRLRFLIAYAGDRKGARRLWREIELGIAALFAHDRKRLRRTSTSNSRRYQRFCSGDWEGWAVRNDSGVERVRDWLQCDVRGGRIEAPAGLWVCSYRAGTDPHLADLWATGVALWVRGLAPRPMGAVQRGYEIRLFFDRSVPGRSEEAADGRELASDHDRFPASAPLTRLLDRLSGLSELSPEITAESVAVFRAADGSSRAALLDVTLLRPGFSNNSGRRARARELSERLWLEVIAHEQQKRV